MIDKRPRHFFLLGSFYEAVANMALDKAYMYDQIHYQELVRSTEDWEMWEKWQKATFPIRSKLAKGMLKNGNSQKQTREVNKSVLLALPNFSGLAHEQQLSRSLNKLQSQGIQFNFNVAYCSTFDINLLNKASKLYNIAEQKIHFIGNKGIEKNSHQLEQLAHSLSAESIIFPSLYYFAYWHSLYINKITTKFIVMKYFPLRTTNIDHFYCGMINCNQYIYINDTYFTQLPVLESYIPTREICMDKRKGETVSFGSISRVEKILDREYNEFIFDILEKTDSVEYLYTGSESSINKIPSVVRNHPKARSLGWVNPPDAIQLYDIYLDPFPWGGGDMTLLALSAAKPYLTLETKATNNHIGIQALLKVMATNFEFLQFSFCKTTEEMSDRFKLLCTDSSLRSKLGTTWQEAVRLFNPKIDGWLHLLDYPSDPPRFRMFEC